MAGRGVDIKLGEGVVDLGGLYVLGTERHESRRIDNQLRGRSGRQGDPGETRFYLSAQDDLVRLFAGDRIHGIMNRFKIPDDQPMEAGILSKQIENAQKKVEEQNFVARKNVLKYDDVMNTQRMVIYDQRRRVLEGEDLSDDVKEWIREAVEAGVTQFTDAEFAEDWDLEGLVTHMQSLYGTDITADELREEVDVASRDALMEEFVEDALETLRGARAGARQPRSRATSSASSSSRSSTGAGASTSRRWTTSARACICARSRRRTRSSSTAARATRCSRSSGDTIRSEVVFTLFHVAVSIEEPALEAAQPRGGASDVRARDGRRRRGDRGRGGSRDRGGGASRAPRRSRRRRRP